MDHVNGMGPSCSEIDPAKLELEHLRVKPKKSPQTLDGEISKKDFRKASLGDRVVFFYHILFLISG